MFRLCCLLIELNVFFIGSAIPTNFLTSNQQTIDIFVARCPPFAMEKFRVFCSSLELMAKLTFIRRDRTHQMEMMNVIWHSLTGRAACACVSCPARVLALLPLPSRFPFPFHVYFRDEDDGSEAGHVSRQQSGNAREDGCTLNANFVNFEIICIFIRSI